MELDFADNTYMEGWESVSLRYLREDDETAFSSQNLPSG